jgi:hypothetical protein
MDNVGFSWRPADYRPSDARARQSRARRRSVGCDREEPRPLREVLGEGFTLLCFYVHDWSPT